MKCSKVKAEDFRIVTDKTEMPVIGVRELSLLTDYLKMDMLAGEIPLGRLGRPEEIAQAVLYLAQAEYVTGQVF